MKVLGTFAVLCAALLLFGCQPAEQRAEEPPSPAVPTTPVVPDQCLEMYKQLSTLDGRIRVADGEIDATAAEADLAKSRFESAARYGGSEGAKRAAPAYEQATQAAANALQAKASLLDQRDGLQRSLQSMGCP